MLPRCWLLRRSERLGHNQCRGLFLSFLRYSSLKYPFRSFAFGHAKKNAVNLEGEDVVVKDHLEHLVLEMYKAGVRCSEAVRQFQKTFILAVLKDQRGNQCKAAKKLGMHRNTLRRTIRELDIDIGPTRATGNRRPPRAERRMSQPVRRQAN
jgi:Fis family transcriptional regulator, factor for inversion stimulation protein